VLHTGAGRRSSAGLRSAGRRPVRRTSPRRRATRSVPAPSSESGGRSADRPRASSRARRPGSATRTASRCWDASCPVAPARRGARSRRRSGAKTLADLRLRPRKRPYAKRTGGGGLGEPGGSPARTGGSKAQGGEEPGQRPDVRGLEAEAAEAGAENARPAANLLQKALQVHKRGSIGLGHEDGKLRRLDDVGVEGDVRAFGIRQGAGDSVGAGVNAARRDELLLRRIEVTGADERDV